MKIKYIKTTKKLILFILFLFFLQDKEDIIIYCRNQIKNLDWLYRFCYLTSFRLHIQFERTGISSEPFFQRRVRSLADEIFGCFISYFRALWHFSVLPRWPSLTFLLRERRNYSYVLPRYFPSCSDIAFSLRYSYLEDKQIPSSLYDHIQRYAFHCHESELTLY